MLGDTLVYNNTTFEYKIASKVKSIFDRKL